MAKITTTSNADLVLEPHGTGDIDINTDTIKIDGEATTLNLLDNSATALTVQSSDGTDMMVLDTSNGTEKVNISSPRTAINLGGNAGDDLTVDTSKLVVEGDTGRVGIGLAAPSQQLHISGATPIIQMTDTDTNADSLISASNASGTLKIQVDNGSEVAGSTFEVDVDGSQRFQVDATGDATITDGDLVIGTEGHGIDFSNQTGTATLDATGTTIAELLDHYETGTWTPTGTLVTAAAAGKYTRIGRQVFCEGYIFTSGSGAGTNTFGGIPFTHDTATNARGGGVCGYQTGHADETLSVQVGTNDVSIYRGSTAKNFINGQQAYYSFTYLTT